MQYHILYLYLRGRSVKLPSAEAVLSSAQCASPVLSLIHISEPTRPY